MVVGQKVRFDPMAHIDACGIECLRGDIVTGTVVYVNYDHEWFLVEYGEHQRTSFKFVDIGREVTICG